MTTLTPEQTQQAWSDVSALVLAGTYDGSDSDTLKSIEIGLRGYPECREATERVRGILEKRKAKKK